MRYLVYTNGSTWFIHNTLPAAMADALRLHKQGYDKPIRFAELTNVQEVRSIQPPAPPAELSFVPVTE